MTNRNETAFAWLNGIEEYIEASNHPQKEVFTDIRKALLHNNHYSIRNLIMRELYRGDPDTSAEFINIIMCNDIDYEIPDDRKLFRYLSHSMDDPFLKDLAIWALKYKNQVNINDHFSRGQVRSKLWLIDELKKLVVSNEIGTIVQYGGWYATIAHFFFKHFNVGKFYNIELDDIAASISEDFNRNELLNDWQFKSIVTDVNDITWINNSYFEATTCNSKGSTVELRISPDIVVNTSCEHMDDSWFENIPEGMIVALQTNNYFENEQHVNCVVSLDEALSKYKFSNVLYSGELETELYTRYMIIGVR